MKEYCKLTLEDLCLIKGNHITVCLPSCYVKRKQV